MNILTKSTPCRSEGQEYPEGPFFYPCLGLYGFLNLVGLTEMLF